MYQTYTAFDVSSDNTYINPPQFDYCWPYWADSDFYIYKDQYNVWINNWWWQVDIGDYDNRCPAIVEDGETYIALTLSVNNCTYAYTYLDEDSYTYGENHYTVESWGQLYF